MRPAVACRVVSAAGMWKCLHRTRSSPVNLFPLQYRTGANELMNHITRALVISVGLAAQLLSDIGWGVHLRMCLCHRRCS